MRIDRGIVVSIDRPEHDYFHLTPEIVLQAIESFGLKVDGRILVLNSYENRVYQVGIEDSKPIVAKFYRPNRWTNKQLQEEHDYTEELYKNELPVVAPLRDKEGQSLQTFHGYRYALYPCLGGRAPEPGNLDHLYRLGVLMGRIHSVGKRTMFNNRPTINVETYCLEPTDFLIENQYISNSKLTHFKVLFEQLFAKLNSIECSISNNSYIRLHCDCHIGNILWSEESGGHFVDFDDWRMGPVIQDLWMLLSGDKSEQSAQLSELIEGYTQFTDFPYREVNLIEYFRTLRIIHTAGWLAKRWDDPAFPLNFPWFNTENYWQQFYQELSTQMQKLDESAIKLY